MVVLMALGQGLTRIEANEAEPPPTVMNVVPVVSTNSPEQTDGVKGVSRRPKEDFKIQLHTNAPPEVSGVTNPPISGFHWDFWWKGWDGLELGISKRTPFKSPRELLGLQPLTNAPTMHLEQLKMSTTIGGVLEVDGAVYRTDGNLNLSDDITLRRARLKAQGDCILIYPVSYKIEIGYIPHKFNLNEGWISSDRIDYIGYVVAGVFQPPMGLDLATSSRDLTFMEPATVLQALAPPTEAGIQIGHPVFNQRGTWALGIFGGGVTAKEYGNASENYGNLIGRITYLAIDQIAPADRPTENQLLHLGLSANAQYSASSVVRYQSRPESYIAPPLINTGDIEATASGAVGAEVAYVNGPFSVQSEFIDSFVRENNGSGLNFYGFYVNASWYLTGESRPYDRVNGISND